MFDQSFSAKNFYNILIQENRKGQNLERRFFETEVFTPYSQTIKEINDKIKTNIKQFAKNDHKNRQPSEDVYKRYKRFLRHKVRKLKKKKEEILLSLLERISQRVQHSSFRFALSSRLHHGKKIYTVNDTPETFFAIKQLQYNFRKLYDVKQSNRFEIINQVRCLLNDKFPKFIIRTDIKEFYESIPNKEILDRLNADNLMSPMSKKFVKQILRDFERLSGTENGVGIPRGIGISAYLAEYYMRRIDRKISHLPNITYYSRYVDDIIIIFTPLNAYHSTDYMAEIKNVIEPHLSLNYIKTDVINLIPSANTINVNGIDVQRHILNYLGYSFELTNNLKKNKIDELTISLTDSKIERYKNKIEASFEVYKRCKDKNKGYRHLKNRLQFLTGNTRLIHNKSNVLVGIYFSNMMLNVPAPLEFLDDFMYNCIRSYVEKNGHREKLLKLSFKKGFEEKKFYHFSSEQFKQIVIAWKDI